MNCSKLAATNSPGSALTAHSSGREYAMAIVYYHHNTLP